MPNYDLYCPSCNQEYNIRASMTQKAEKQIPCPDCGNLELETVYKSPPAHVKGSAPVGCPNRGGCGGSCPHAG